MKCLYLIEMEIIKLQDNNNNNNNWDRCCYDLVLLSDR